MVLAAGGVDASARKEALERLCSIYWKPVYAFARRHGLSAPDAEDATQGFFAWILEVDWVSRADPQRGRFRGFLLTSFRHFLSNERQRAGAKRRGGGIAFIEIDAATLERNLDLSSCEADPAREFDRTFALAIMERAAARLAEEQDRIGQREQFVRLRRFINEPPKAGEYEALAHELRLAKGAIAVRVHRLAKRHRELVRAEVAATLVDRSDIESELRHLLVSLAS